MKYTYQENRKTIHNWLKFQPECIKFIETLAKHLDEETREQIFQLLADYWRWGGYPGEDRHNQYSAEAKYIATHLIYYIQFIGGQRTQLPNHEHIPVTNHYLRCFAITHGKTRRRKSDPLVIPKEYDFLEGLV